MNSRQVAIIGTGLCGLTLSELLESQKHSSFLLEKSKSVGGRMATRRDLGATYDHGAAFYKHSIQHPFLWNDRWMSRHRSKKWYEDSVAEYYCAQSGMTALAKDLAIGKNIFFQQKVISIRSSDDTVEIQCDSGQVYTADLVVLTCPLPQSLDILRASQISYPQVLQNITYAKSLVALLQIDQLDSELNFNYKTPETSIFSISNNRLKGISDENALTVVMTPEWSHLHYHFSDEEILHKIKNELNSCFKKNITVNKAQLKKWLYAHPLSTYSELFYKCEKDSILLAGDAFGGASLAGATRSAQAVFSWIESLH